MPASRVEADAAFEVAMRRVTGPAAGCAIGLAVALVWAEGAVGLFA